MAKRAQDLYWGVGHWLHTWFKQVQNRLRCVFRWLCSEAYITLKLDEIILFSQIHIDQMHSKD